LSQKPLESTGKISVGFLPCLQWWSCIHWSQQQNFYWLQESKVIAWNVSWEGDFIREGKKAKVWNRSGHTLEFAMYLIWKTKWPGLLFN